MGLNYFSFSKSIRAFGLIVLMAFGPAIVKLYAQSDEDCMMCHEDPEMEGMLHGRMESFISVWHSMQRTLLK